jgi:alginate O-acetyltransferase complex protein AlgI
VNPPLLERAPRTPVPGAAAAVIERPAAAPGVQETADELRARHALPNVGRFLLLALQFLLLVVVFRAFELEERAFVRMAGVAWGGFVVHYWLPFRYKEPFWIALSLLGATILLGLPVVLILCATGGLFFLVLASGLAFSTKVGVMVLAGVGLMAARGVGAPGIPAQVWPVLGALFMFRMMIYMYDLRHAKSRPSLREYLAYFYPLPNFYFLLFPVIDFQTQRRTYYQRDIHDIAQQGLLWIARGTVQLLLYRLVYHLKPVFNPAEITSAGSLAALMVMTYLLYLRVSGQFHIIVGLMHLFGYDLPETHRRYLLARSLTDFWRRINIYWKDFMVKLVYFPVYFQFRRSGEVRAQIVATACVFFVTWLLHSYQWFWLRGEFLFSWPDTLFWGLLGGLVIVNLLIEKRRRGARYSAGWPAKAIHALQVCGTFVFMTTLWSFWHAPSVEEWFELLAWWRGR